MKRGELDLAAPESNAFIFDELDHIEHKFIYNYVYVYRSANGVCIDSYTDGPKMRHLVLMFCSDTM